MKRFISVVVLAACVLFMMQAVALADTGKLGKEYTLEGECTFTVNSAKAYDVFFNQESKESKQWIVVSVDVLNWRDDSFYVKAETEAKVVYDGDFEYSQDYLWANPEGSYYSTSANNTLYIYEMDSTGKIYSNGKDKNGGYARPVVNFTGGYDRVYDPINDMFYYPVDGHTSPWAYGPTDGSKTILDPLVRRTYHYVFLVPDLVAAEEGMRELIFTVVGEEYSFRF